MTPHRNQLHARFAALALVVSLGAAAACSLSPQPLPPGAQPSGGDKMAPDGSTSPSDGVDGASPPPQAQEGGLSDGGLGAASEAGVDAGDGGDGGDASADAPLDAPSDAPVEGG